LIEDINADSIDFLKETVNFDFI